MATHVTDVRSNPEEQIAHAAKVLRKSKHAQMIFEEIYRGKTKIKTVQMLMQATGLNNVRVLQIGAKLVGNNLVGTTKVNSRTAYFKDRFYNQHRDKILRLARNPVALKAYPTRNNPQPGMIRIVLDLQRRSVQVQDVAVDDIESFSRVKQIRDVPSPRPMDESSFKAGIKRILGEEGEFQDWGGEQNDLFTTRLVIRGHRIATAFGFKGKGTAGILTPKKMGKNGDQIQRLFKSEASAFLVQYWGQIDQTVLEQMNRFAVAKSSLEGIRIYYGIIDGKDTQRLVSAYPECF